MKTLAFAGALMGLALGATVSANAAILDFDSGQASYSGLNNLTGYSQDGMDFAISLDSGDPRASGANLFDTSACANSNNQTTNCNGNDDGDLVPTTAANGVSGNVLIRQENGNRGNQFGALDDDATGTGSITFELLSGSAFRLLGFSAVDDGRFSILVNGQELGSLAPGADRASASTTFGVSPIINVGGTFTVRFEGSGAVDSIRLAPVPVPAALPMLIVGLGGLGALARRRRRAA
ncbi:MAG: VPLPA-CTERM sorting domain-containing protein [Pseudomonadota bacterium]